MDHTISNREEQQTPGSRAFFQRLRASPGITAVEPGLTEPRVDGRTSPEFVVWRSPEVGVAIKATYPSGDRQRLFTCRLSTRADPYQVRDRLFKRFHDARPAQTPVDPSAAEPYALPPGLEVRLAELRSWTGVRNVAVGEPWTIKPGVVLTPFGQHGDYVFEVFIASRRAWHLKLYADSPDALAGLLDRLRAHHQPSPPATPPPRPAPKAPAQPKTRPPASAAKPTRRRKSRRTMPPKSRRAPMPHHGTSLVLSRPVVEVYRWLLRRRPSQPYAVLWDVDGRCARRFPKYAAPALQHLRAINLLFDTGVHCGREQLSVVIRTKTTN